MVAIRVPQRDFPRPLAERARPARCGHPWATPEHGRVRQPQGKVPPALGSGSRGRSRITGSVRAAPVPAEELFASTGHFPGAALPAQRSLAQPGGQPGTCPARRQEGALIPALSLGPLAFLPSRNIITKDVNLCRVLGQAWLLALWAPVPG